MVPCGTRLAPAHRRWTPRRPLAVEAVQKADAAIVAVGIIEGEGYDRTHLELPGGQEALIRAVAATGKPTDRGDLQRQCRHDGELDRQRRRCRRSMVSR